MSAPVDVEAIVATARAYGAAWQALDAAANEPPREPRRVGRQDMEERRRLRGLADARDAAHKALLRALGIDPEAP